MATRLTKSTPLAEATPEAVLKYTISALRRRGKAARIPTENRDWRGDNARGPLYLQEGPACVGFHLDPDTGGTIISLALEPDPDERDPLTGLPSYRNPLVAELGVIDDGPFADPEEEAIRATVGFAAAEAAEFLERFLPASESDAG